jgi:hypothetical protein
MTHSAATGRSPAVEHARKNFERPATVDVDAVLRPASRAHRGRPDGLGAGGLRRICGVSQLALGSRRRMRSSQPPPRQT